MKRTDLRLPQVNPSRAIERAPMLSERSAESDAVSDALTEALEEPMPRVPYSPKGLLAMDAMFNMAIGPGTPHDDAERVRLLKVAAGRDPGLGSGVAWLKLGHLHQVGAIVDQYTRMIPSSYTQYSPSPLKQTKNARTSETSMGSVREWTCCKP